MRRGLEQTQSIGPFLWGCEVNGPYLWYMCNHGDAARGLARHLYSWKIVSLFGWGQFQDLACSSSIHTLGRFRVERRVCRPTTRACGPSAIPPLASPHHQRCAAPVGSAGRLRKRRWPLLTISFCNNAANSVRVHDSKIWQIVRGYSEPLSRLFVKASLSDFAKLGS